MPGAEPSFGFGLPQYQQHVGRPGAVASLAVGAEQAGFSTLWSTENLNNPSLSSLGLLAHVAAVTERVELGVGVVLLPLRMPVALARDLATIDVLSGGRLIAGVGIGRRRPELYAEYGLPAGGRLDRYLAGLDVLRRLLREGSATYEGPEWTMSGVSTVPAPVRPPPIWVAAREEVAIRRAVHVGDGWLGSGKADRHEVARSIGFVNDELERSGRDPAGFAIGCRMYLLLDPTHSSRLRLAQWYGRVHGDQTIADRAVFSGDAEACRERVAELRELGMQHIILNPVFDYERHLDRLGSDVLPAFAAAVA